VLLDSSFMTIVVAIKQGRTTFSNIRKVVVYLFTDCFQEMVVIGTAVLAGWPLPILPAQILWIKLIESPLPATSLSFEESDGNVLSDKPRGRNVQLLSGQLKFNIAFYAFVMDVIALSVFYFYWKSTGDLDKTRTLFNIYNIRSLGKSVFKANPLKNRFLVIATIIGFLLFLLAVYSEFMNGVLQTVPLGAKDWIIIFLYSFASLLVFEIGKKLMRYKI
jgi:P-type Ca2+ transporter type 2C